ncbi:MAG: WYL domain-containing protein [Caldilineaceae bacterium]|nr:WYL domain-containing protein [Caldilineaceae bacterium]
MPLDNASLRRSLCLLRRLQIGPASRDTLAEQVYIECEGDGYNDFADARDIARFENDIKRLRNLGILVRHRKGEYYLFSYNTFDPVALPPPALDALAFLAETFAPGAPNSDQVQELLRLVTDWLPQRQRDLISTRRQRLRVDLRRVDEDDIDPVVEEALGQAISQRRLLRFDYLSPGQADGVPRCHKVQPYKIYFDTARRHLYLDAYWLEVDGPRGQWKPRRWQKFRLGRILAESVEVLPQRFGSLEPKRPRVRLEYLLAPEIARLGEISRHFDDMEIHPPDSTGWVRVTATTDDLFAATRLLLRYAHNCKVIGGPEARREMEVLVRALADLYGGGERA